ncbi:MAG: hypothetical protein WA942_03210 [Mycolicibacter sinensis]
MTEINVIDAEIVEPLTRVEADRLDNRIRLLVGNINDTFTKLTGLVEQAKSGQIHTVLGYASWTAYISDVFTVTIRLDRAQRRELVGYLAGEGMSQRAIADVVGTGVGTVNRDLAGVPNGTPEPHHPAFTDAAEQSHCMTMADVPDDEFEDVLAQARTEGDLSPHNVVSICRGRLKKKITGRDGKQYPAKSPEPSKPRRGSITDSFWRAKHDLGKVVARVERLANDDRFDRNRDTIAGENLVELIRARDELNRVIDMLGGAQ